MVAGPETGAAGVTASVVCGRVWTGVGRWNIDRDFGFGIGFLMTASGNEGVSDLVTTSASSTGGIMATTDKIQRSAVSSPAINPR
jgi:hypothetical protein